MCEELKIKPRTVQWSALGIRVDQAEWILAKNIERRNLTDDQRVTIYVEYEEWRLREDAKKNQASKLKKGASFACPECGDSFPAPVVHCPRCDHHWPEGETECNNCRSNSDDYKLPVQQVSVERGKKSLNATRDTVAEKANVSTYKAEQALKLNKAVETGAVAPVIILVSYAFFVLILLPATIIEVAWRALEKRFRN